MRACPGVNRFVKSSVDMGEAIAGEAFRSLLHDAGAHHLSLEDRLEDQGKTLRGGRRVYGPPVQIRSCDLQRPVPGSWSTEVSSPIEDRVQRVRFAWA